MSLCFNCSFIITLSNSTLICSRQNIKLGSLTQSFSIDLTNAAVKLSNVFYLIRIVIFQDRPAIFID